MGKQRDSISLDEDQMIIARISGYFNISITFCMFTLNCTREYLEISPSEGTRLSIGERDVEFTIKVKIKIDSECSFTQINDYSKHTIH